MTTWTRALLLVAASAGVASAQLPPQPQPQPQPGDGTQPTDMQPQPQPEPQPQPQPQPQPPPPPPAPEPQRTQEMGDRPEGMTMGIGAGYLLPDSLETPNVTSVRFRLESGLTLEPVVSLTQLNRSVDTGDESTTTIRNLGIGALIRHTLSGRGRYDFDFLGGAFVNTVMTNPENDDNNTSDTSFDLVYGLSVATWINPHWVVSFSATNPVASYTRSRQEQGPDQVRVDTDFLVGAIWSPTVTAMVHLYY